MYAINEKEPKPLAFRRAQTYCKEKISNIPKADSHLNAVNKLKRNIELVYNQVSPEKIQAKSILNSPSERSRANTSIKRKYFQSDLQLSVEPSNIKEEKPEDFPQKKKETHFVSKNEFTQILQKNTPKYTFFTPKNQQKIVEEPKENPLSHIYHSQTLLNILKLHKTGLGRELLSKKTKAFTSQTFVHHPDIEKQKTKNSNGSSNFKIRKFSNPITTRDVVEKNEQNPKNEGKHRKFKSNVTFKTENDEEKRTRIFS